MLRIFESHDGKPTAAVGDIHGEAALLRTLLVALEEMGRELGGLRIVTLGDYIDRGEAAREVIERLLEGPIHACNDYIHLKGNHDQFMLDGLRDPSPTNMSRWMRSGGLQTLGSYGVDDEDMLFDGSWRTRIPPEHVAFLEGLHHAAIDAERIFVHAGLRPGIPFEAQTEYDLLWIRDEFLENDHDFGRLVVHGHTASVHPVIRPTRMNIDTEAYGSGVLTAALFGTGVEMIQAVQQKRHGVPTLRRFAPAPSYGDPGVGARF